MLLDDFLFEHLYNAVTVAVALIVYGVAFLFLENRRQTPRVRSVDALDYKTAVLIGCFQALSIIPGTSRSGSTILGAMILGLRARAGRGIQLFPGHPDDARRECSAGLQIFPRLRLRLYIV